MNEIAHNIGHEAILASAGSGKTYQLVIRYLRLLAREAPEDRAPERIVALTFTRKAAGEFLARIFQRLAEAAASAAAAARLAAEMQMPHLGPGDFLSLLRLLSERLHLLRLGTIDSFHLTLVRAFALEFGLPPAVTLVPEELGHHERRRAIEGLLGGSGCAPLAPRLMEGFARARAGEAPKDFQQALEQLVQSHHAAWLAAPRADCWGDVRAIWPLGAWWQRHKDLEVNTAPLREWLETAPLKKGALQQWGRILDQFDEHVPGSKPQSSLKGFLEKLADQRMEFVSASRLTLSLSKCEHVLEGETLENLRRLVGSWIARELALCCERTAGLAALLDCYEQAYEELVRRQGRLSFEDVTLLAARRCGSLRGILLDERLDGQLDHWLLDEFQDTNCLQWKALEPLVSEVISDTDRRRTYFQVGDVKQAIYGFRGGEPELAPHVIRHYQLPQRTLSTSYRSAPPIIEMVNAVFGNEEVRCSLSAGLSGAAWPWEPHTTARTDLTGCAAVISPDEHDESCLETAARLVCALQPLSRGLTCAVLLRSNDKVKEMAAILRAADPTLPVVCESDVAATVDNPVTAVLLSMLQAAAHPEDTYAWRHLQMTPLWSVLEEKELAELPRLSSRTLRDISRQGFEAWAGEWIAALDGCFEPHDAYSRGRCRALLAAAREFDLGGSRDIDEFLEFCRRQTQRETASSLAIQVMTVHKAKGLDYDIVVLPQLSSSFTQGGVDLLRKRQLWDVDWVLQPPPSPVMKLDDHLGEQYEREQEIACREGACAFYVAMTRARRGLYLIMKRKDCEGCHPERWVHDALPNDAGELPLDGATFATSHVIGDPQWHAAVAARPPAAATAADQQPFDFRPRRRRLPRATPSGVESHVLTPAQVFSPTSESSRRTGILVHSLLEQVERSADLTAMDAWWKRHHPVPDALEQAALEEVRRCLGTREIAGLFDGPAHSRVLREQRFEIVHDGRWISGTIDRVVVHGDSATILDFKTDAVAGLEEARKRSAGYCPQMEIYAVVVSRLLGIPLTRVQTHLIFTRLPAAISVA